MRSKHWSASVREDNANRASRDREYQPPFFPTKRKGWRKRSTSAHKAADSTRSCNLLMKADIRRGRRAKHLPTRVATQ